MLKSEIKNRRSRDNELFGFGKKYESKLEFYKFDDYIKIDKDTKFKFRPDKHYNMFTILQFSSNDSGPIGHLSTSYLTIDDDDVDLASDTLDERIDIFKKQVGNMMSKKTSIRVIKPDSFIGSLKDINNLDKRDDRLLNQVINGLLDLMNAMDRNTKFTSARSEKNIRWMITAYKHMVDGFSLIRKFLNNNINEVSKNDKESYDLNLRDLENFLNTNISR